MAIFVFLEKILYKNVKRCRIKCEVNENNEVTLMNGVKENYRNSVEEEEIAEQVAELKTHEHTKEHTGRIGNEDDSYVIHNRAKSRKVPIIIGILVFFIIAIGVALAVEYLAAPIVKVKGESVIELEYGANYDDAGISAYTKFKDISDSIIVKNSVDSSKVGTYDITYKVPYRNDYKIYTRKVTIKDTTAPIITLNGDENFELEYGKEYQEPGFNAEDGYDGNITDKVKVEKVDTENGNYDIHYIIEDSSNNRAEKIRHIKITDSTPPVIKLKGNSYMTISIGAKYEEQGAIAKDNKDGDLSSKIIIEGNNIDTSKEGKYKVKYKITDSNGNEAIAERTIAVGNSQATGVIYLTFDDGPSTTTTPKILDILKEKGVKATFFVINYKEGSTSEELLKREVEEGHAIGIHGYSHDYSKVYASVDDCFNNFKSLQDKIEKTTGVKSWIIRFPGGSSNTVSKKYCAGVVTNASKKLLEAGFKYYDWNVLSGDSGDVKTKEGVYNNVTKGIKPGRNNVVLMHDFNGNNKTVEALPDIIDYGLKNGYKFEIITTDTEMVTQRIQN